MSELIKVTIHDQGQIELDIDLPSLNHQSYYIDLFFYFPQSLGVNPESYPRHQFYNDLTDYLRFHTADTVEIEKDTFWGLEHYLTHKHNPLMRRTHLPWMQRQICTFGGRVNAKLKYISQQLYIKRRNNRRGLSDEFLKQMLDELFKLEKILKIFRDRYVNKFIKPSLFCEQEIRKVVLLVDEYISNRIVSSLPEIIRLLQKSGLNSSNNKILSRLINLHKIEMNYRNTREDIFVLRKKNVEELEYFYYRLGQLKKFVSAPLYIETKKTKLDKVYRNWVAVIGASLAATWATLINIHTYRVWNVDELGFRLFFLLLLGVVAYIFKDRIKELSKEYFNQKLKVLLPDFKGRFLYNICFPDGREEKVLVGSFKEYMEYKNSIDIIPPVRFIRSMSGRRDVSDEMLESVIHYNKKIYLNIKNLEEKIPQATCLKEILRFNFSYFFKHLDDPLKKSYVYDPDDGPAKINVPRVYHINLITKIRTEDDQDNYSHFRFVVNKKGLIRIKELFKGPSSTNKKKRETSNNEC